MGMWPERSSVQSRRRYGLQGLLAGDYYPSRDLEVMSTILVEVFIGSTLIFKPSKGSKVPLTYNVSAASPYVNGISNRNV